MNKDAAKPAPWPPLFQQWQVAAFLSTMASGSLCFNNGKWQPLFQQWQGCRCAFLNRLVEVTGGEGVKFAE
jgi:hypothetical protein